MKNILTIFAFLFITTIANAAVVGAGDLRWEQFHDSEISTLKYNLDSVTMFKREYRAEVWMYTKFKQPMKGKGTLNEAGEQVQIKYIFQKLFFNCNDVTYTQKEFIVYRWSDEAKVGHLQTNETYSIVAGSPMERLRGIVCYGKNIR
jgi:hypothetical protein